jgi:hypothetical protein
MKKILSSILLVFFILCPIMNTKLIYFSVKEVTLNF